MMYSIRRWLFRPKKTDSALLAKFYFTDEELNLVAAELDSFDGRKDPERCTALVTKLRSCQDKVLNVIEKIILDAIPTQKANRDFRVKFPDDVLQESLAGQLWFGAECLAAGSSIMNRELESASMRPLARALTKNLDRLRSLLREQCLRSYNYNERIKEALVIFDKLFAEFEYSYVSTMVPVKSKKEYDLLQEITVLFSETVQRALKIKLLTQDQIDDCDPALMFTIPRLAIVCGLLIYPNGPINPICDRSEMSEMFRPFQTLLLKIKELLHTLTSEELTALEKSLCTNECVEKVKPSSSSVDQKSQTDPGFEDSTEESACLEKTLYSNDNVFNDGIEDKPVESQSTSSHGEDFISTLNKSESRDSGLQSENASTSGTVSSDIVSPDETKSVLEDDHDTQAVDISHLVAMTTDNVPCISCSGNNLDVVLETESIDDICLSIIDNIIKICVENSDVLQGDLCSDCDKHAINNKADRQENVDFQKQSDSDRLVSLSSSGKLGCTDNSSSSNTRKEVESCCTSKHDEEKGHTISTTDKPSASHKHVCPSNSTDKPSTAHKHGEQRSSTKIPSTSQKHGQQSRNTNKPSNSQKPVQQSNITSKACSSHSYNQGEQGGSRSHSKLTRQTRKASIDRIHCKTGSNTSGSVVQRVRRVQYNGTISNTFASVHDSNYDWERDSISSTGSSDTSSYTSDSQDDEEIELAVKAAAVASKNEIRSRFRSSSDLIHRLFVCISGVADQLQTNYAGDLRNILKSVFDMNTSCEPDEIESVGTKFDRTQHIQAQLQAARVNRYRRSNSSHSHRAREPPEWVPDDQVISCTSCRAVFTFVRRRHHCRNCGKIFCGQCSNNVVPLPHFGHSTPVRVCNRCFMFQVTPFTVES